MSVTKVRFIGEENRRQKSHNGDNLLHKPANGIFPVDNRPLAYTVLTGYLPGACTRVVVNIIGEHVVPHLVYAQSVPVLHLRLSQRTHVHTNADKWLQMCDVGGSACQGSWFGTFVLLLNRFHMLGHTRTPCRLDHGMNTGPLCF